MHGSELSIWVGLFLPRYAQLTAHLHPQLNEAVQSLIIFDAAFHKRQSRPIHNFYFDRTSLSAFCLWKKKEEGE